jgi:hypothetical protein
MSELKTKLNDASVDDFLNGFPEEARKDCYEILKMMKQATKAEPKMWGASIIGFGSRPYKYANGREAEWMVIGFSPRKQNLTLYLGNLEQHETFLKMLGKHTTGKGCLYIKRLSDVDKKILKELITKSAQVKTINQ